MRRLHAFHALHNEGRGHKSGKLPRLHLLVESADLAARIFLREGACTSPLHNVPATTQQLRPAFLPSWMPSSLCSTVAGQIPRSARCIPPGSLPHFLNSQQLSLSLLAAILPPDTLALTNYIPQCISIVQTKKLHRAEGEHPGACRDAKTFSSDPGVERGFDSCRGSRIFSGKKSERQGEKYYNGWRKFLGSIK
jgi:hypothetical protein